MNGECSIHEQLRKQGITPDYHVENSIHHIIANRDTVPAFALQNPGELKELRPLS